MSRAKTQTLCFNPRPPCKGGATKRICVSLWLWCVSILAPLARGALHRDRLSEPNRTEFQSSPPLQGGRYTHPGGHDVACRCFNPRPPCKGGATRPLGSRGRRWAVSILAPLARGALLVRVTTGSHWRIVSILAPLARGALHTSVDVTWLPNGFQSSPPLQGGRYISAGNSAGR